MTLGTAQPSRSDVVRLLSRQALPRAPEKALQDAIARLLGDAGFSYEREVRLTTSDVIDFVVGDRLGVEVKIGGSTSDVTRQLHRYAQSERVAELLLVTTRSRHKQMPSAFAGKSIRVLHLEGGAF